MVIQKVNDRKNRLLITSNNEYICIFDQSQKVKES